MRRKLKKLNKLLEKGVIKFDTIQLAYESWKGHIGQYSSKKRRYKRKDKCFRMHTRNCKRNMDKLFNELFIENWHYETQFW